MSSAYVPPALRARQSSAQASSDRSSYSSRQGSSYGSARRYNNDSSSQYTSNARAGPSGYNGDGAGPGSRSDSYRQTTSYSAPGRPRNGPYSAASASADGSGDYTGGREYPQPGNDTTRSERNGGAIRSGAYRTPAQRAQDRQDAEARLRQGRTGTYGREQEKDDWPTYDTSSGSLRHDGGRNDWASSGGVNMDNRASSGPGRARTGGHAYSSYTSPSLYVFGDSFVGPMKLLNSESARCQTYKGASAKGLNNANSAKQVAKQLTPSLNGLIAPEYGYIPKSGRWALLIFGNVDLQINYLWQLQHKPLTASSFPSGTTLPAHVSAVADGSESGVGSEDEDGPSTGPAVPRRKNHVLANATETSLSGHALGPMLFVEAVVKAYTAYLEREIVGGPIGTKLQARARKQKEMEAAGNGTVTAGVPGKVLVAGALPPLVQDDVLARIPEKYVERLEDEHEKAQKALGREPKWRTAMEDEEGGSSKGQGKDDNLHQDLAKLSLRQAVSATGGQDRGRPSTPPSTSSTVSAGSNGTSTTAHTDFVSGSISTAPSSPPSTSYSASDYHKKDATPTDAAGDDRYSVAYLLAHDPPLCTLPVRVQMTDRYNELLRDYVLSRPDVLDWIDIGPVMRQADDAALASPSATAHGTTAVPLGSADTEERRLEAAQGIVDRQTWACPVDPTNVHPLWEPTLPLWLAEMDKLGLPTGTWRMDEEADETFRLYEEDKRRRTMKREAEWAAEAEEAAAAR